MNKMDDYYKKQLSDHEPAEDGWNIPSEELWNKAQPHFPKPKKKRKYIFFFLTTGLVLLVSTYFFLQDSLVQPIISLDNPNSTAQPTQLSTDSNRSITKSNAQIKTEIKSDLLPPIYSNADGHVATQNNKTYASTDLETLKNDTDSTPSFSGTKPILKKKEIVALDNVTSSSLSKIINSSNSSNEKTTSESNYNASQINSGSKTFSRELITLAFINSIETKLLRNNHQPSIANINDKPQIAPTVNNLPFLRNEIGIGSSLHLLTLLGEVENGENPQWPDEEIFIKAGNTKNLNLHYNYFLSKNWFISTGAYYDHLNLNIYGDTSAEMDQESIDGIVKTNLNDGVANNRQTNEYLMELLPGESVSIGDTLQVGLDVDLSLDVYQLPLLVNRKWDIKRTELFVGLGGSIGYSVYKLKSADIELFRDNQLISKPYQEGPGEVEDVLTFDFIFQTGIHYNITNKLKFGLAGRIFMPQLFPTGIEARFLYKL